MFSPRATATYPSGDGKMPPMFEQWFQFDWFYDKMGWIFVPQGQAKVA
jgi:hypothetical protein